MKILFLSFIALVAISCGKGRRDSWTAPNMYFLRNNSDKNTILSVSEHLDLNDYIYFSTSAENPSLKNKSDSYILIAQAACITGGKSYRSEAQVIRNYIQLKEFLPVESLLADTTSCKMNIVLKNSKDSTKSYVISERTIDVKDFKNDLEFPSKINFTNFDSQKILSKDGDEVRFVCDSVSYSSTGSSTLTFGKILENQKHPYKDIDLTQYKAVQMCRIAIKSSAEFLLSQKFEIHFQKLLPKYSYSIYTKRAARRTGARLYLYDLTLTNTNDVPLSIAVNKNALVVPLYQSHHHGTGDHDAPDTYTDFQDTASLSISNPTLLVEKGNLTVIYLLPGETISIQAFKDSGCDGMTCVSSQMNDSHMPIYNLEYNYRTREEIDQATDIKLSEQLIAN